MNREILFKGKRKDNGEWVEGYYVFDECTVIVKGLSYSNRNDGKIEMPLVYPVDPATVGQFTGLVDKNGKRIFEGDIVRHHNDNPYAIPTIIEKGEVFWDERTCGWRRTSNGAFHHGVVDTYRLSHECVYEVIGNIHDHHSLLQG